MERYITQDSHNNLFSNVLDFGHLRLVDSMGSDLSIVRNARVSYDADWRAGEDSGSDARLIQYLIKNHHNTPIESVCLTFDIKAPIFVFRQWHRHRTQSYNELSARYRPLPNEIYIPKPWNLGKQNKDNKQMRDVISREEYEELPSSEKQEILEVLQNIKDSTSKSYIEYSSLLEKNVPRELARGVLPFNTYSHMFATMNLHNCFRFLSERLHTHAQFEIREYAIYMLHMIKTVAPVATQAFIDFCLTRDHIIDEVTFERLS